MNTSPDSNLSTARLVIYWSLIAGNIIGAIGGFVWWYGPQFLRTPWYLWLFTPDCPLYALLFGVVFAWMLLTKKKGGLFTFLVCIGLLKYGLWTVASQVFIFTTRPDYVMSNYGIIIMVWLVVSHLVMFFESLLLLRRMKEIKISWIALVTGWFLLNDYIDYIGIGGFTTITSLPGGMTFYATVALVATFAFPQWARAFHEKVLN